MPLKCAVIDDEPLARELMKSYVERTQGLQLVGVFETPTEAVKTVLSGELDIIFLDINMPCINGIDFGALVPQTTRIIYVTAYDKYAVEGYKVNALDYLLKPVAYPDFLKAVGKAVEWRNMRDAMDRASTNDTEYIVVKSEYKTIQFPLDTIKYIEVQKDYLNFYLDKTDTPVTSLMNLKTLEMMLPSDKFMRIHRSYIVNLNKIEVIEKNRIVFGNTYLPISDSYRPMFTEFLKRRTP
jgi:DNA-binding LytR/AlgR family response regulator